MPAMTNLTSCMILELKAIAKPGYQPSGRCRTGSILATLKGRGLVVLKGSRDPGGPGWKLTDEGRKVLHRLERQGVI